MKNSLDIINKELEFWEEAKRLYLCSTIQENDTFIDAAFKAYMLTFSATDSAALLNENNYRIPTPRGSRKVESKDITTAIEKNSIENKNLEKLVKKVQGKNMRISKKIQ